MGANDVLLWTFEFMFHTDKANAYIHCSPVKFSPITFRLASELLEQWPEGQDITSELAEIKSHFNQYLGR